MVGKDVIVSSVIKGNAYGHGINSFVPMAERCGVDHFSVFSASEAERAFASRRNDSHIMIMGDLHNDEYAWAIENGISFYIYNLVQLKAAIKTASTLGKKALVHLELETGMNRLGLEQEELKQALNLVKASKNSIEVMGICTHYAGAESIGNFVRVHDQIASFNSLCQYAQKMGIISFVKHSASSSATLIYPETRMDMVRVGIAQFGFWPTEEVRMRYLLEHQPQNSKRFNDPLKRVLSWKSRIINIKEVGPGEFVGYGIAYLTTKKQKIAAVPVGYYHGFARSLSNLGRVLVNGKRAAVVGVVNMNMMLINVSDIKNVNINDEVVLIGKQKKLQISVASFSDMTNNLNYEILTRLPEEIPRLVVD